MLSSTGLYKNNARETYKTDFVPIVLDVNSGSLLYCNPVTGT